MSDSSAGRRAVTAFFDDRAAAQKAIDDLAAAGVARDRINLVEGGGAEPEPADAVPSRSKGIWDTVKDLFMADEDRHAYGEGLRRGGFLLSVTTAGDDARVIDVLDREGAVDMDARQGDWELEGWDPTRAAADLRAVPPADIRAAVEPVGAVGPAFGVGEEPADRRAVMRDRDAAGSRVRSYMQSGDRPDAAR